MRALTYMVCFLSLCCLATATIVAIQTKAVCMEQTVTTTVRNEARQLVEQVQVQRSCQMGFGIFPRA